MSSNEQFCFIAVKFEEVILHPVFDVCQRVCDGGENDWSDGFGRDLQLCIASIAVEVKSMAAYVVSKGQHVENEEEGTEH